MRRSTFTGAALLVLTLLLAACGHDNLGASAASGSSINSSSANEGVIERVVDGDTVVATIKGKSTKIRLIGMDTPETVDPRRPVGCYGKEASDYTKHLLPKGTGVHLDYDVDHLDKYGRTLAYVYRKSDSLFVNADLVRNGYAQILTIPPNVAHVDEFTQLQTEARNANAGLWSACQ